ELLAVRKHAGLIVPFPIQGAMVAALDDDTHVQAQRERYRSRREQLVAAVQAAGFRIDHSEAGLYLWATRDEDSRV
ncbi:aminotransferase class I/II-fold pyridoxal phosphate-dependent enzyme, partial [Streptomyces sp. SID10244]|nr:aminotransferase class I/II-fold pyridoxal phosphate-dependent enzyme [Streptomyces sp. SID10244]